MIPYHEYFVQAVTLTLVLSKERLLRFTTAMETLALSHQMVEMVLLAHGAIGSVRRVMYAVVSGVRACARNNVTRQAVVTRRAWVRVGLGHTEIRIVQRRFVRGCTYRDKAHTLSATKKRRFSVKVKKMGIRLENYNVFERTPATSYVKKFKKV